MCVSVVTLPGPGTSLSIASRYMLCFRGGYAMGSQCLCVSVVTSCFVCLWRLHWGQGRVCPWPQGTCSVGVCVCLCLCVCGDFTRARDKFAYCLKVHALLGCVGGWVHA